jgi:glucose-6-phosphate isomerase
MGRAMVEAHMSAVSTNLAETSKFGVRDQHVFGFWDWVGGRYSVCSAIGVLPLSIQYGFEYVNEFLNGANAMDTHFRSAPT